MAAISVPPRVSYGYVGFITLPSGIGLQMLWYVAFIAAVNLGLGYLCGAYFRPCPRCAKARAMGLSLLAPAPIAEPGPPIGSRIAAPPPIPQEAPAADDAPAEPAADLLSRDEAESLVARLANGDADSGPVTAALVEVAPLDSSEQLPGPGIRKRMLCGISNLVRQSLSPDHALAEFSERQLLLLFPQEDVEQVTQRAEEFRQRVATTEFMAEGHSYQTTVTCALAEISGQRMGPRLYDFLQEALDEAKRYGGNRTFMHDGRSPTPVVPAELAIAAQQLAI